MLIDELMPRWDATRIEHAIITGEPADVYAAVLRADFIEAWKGNDAVRALFAVRAAAERVASTLLGSSPSLPEREPEAMRIGEMAESGEWVRLGERPPEEISFGAIGRFWSGKTIWLKITAEDFGSFSREGFARIGCSISLRPYGPARTLVTYESRTAGTDPASTRAFMRYWRLVFPFVGVVMRSMLAVIEREASAVSPAPSMPAPRG